MLCRLCGADTLWGPWVTPLEGLVACDWDVGCSLVACAGVVFGFCLLPPWPG